MSNPVVWFELYVDDMVRAKAFYEAVLGVALTRLESGEIEMWAFPSQMESYGAAGALVRMPDLPSGGNSTVVYFHSEDCAVEAARVAQHGGRVQKEKTSIAPHGFIALVLDTEDNLIGLHSMK